MPTLRNTNPLGAVEVPLLGRTLEAGEEFEVDDATAASLLAQVGNYEPAGPTGDDDGLADLTVAQLRQVAAERGVDLTGATTKAEIVHAIETSTTSQEG